MTTTTAESIEILAQFESWREETLLAGPDVSLTAYIRVLEAAEPDPRIAEIHALVQPRIEYRDVRSKGTPEDVALFMQIAMITEPDTIEHADVEVFPY